MLGVLKRGVVSALRSAGYDLVRVSAPQPTPQAAPPPPPLPPPPPAVEPVVVAAPTRPTAAPAQPEPLRSAAGLAESIIGQPPQPLSPPMFDELARRYAEYTDPRDKEVISRAVMDLAFADDRVFNVMKNATGPTELHRQMSGAIAFGEGALSRCASIFKALNVDHRSTFISLCFGRALVADGKTDEAIKHFRAEHVSNPADHDAGLQLATLLFWVGDTDEANAVLAKFVHLLEFEREVVIPRQAELQRAIDTKQAYPDASSDDFYTDDYTVKTWWGYFQAFQRSPYREPDAALESKVRSEVAKRLAAKASGATTFIDFGAFCGYSTHKLALEFPNTRFVGIDRPKITRDLSDKYFKAPNLEFVADDLLAVLDSWKDLGNNAVLFHSRTAVFCYPEYMRQLYTMARTRGVRHIIYQEGDTFSRWYRKFYEYGHYPEIAINSRSKMWMHDFGRLLPDTGFKIDSVSPSTPTSCSTRYEAMVPGTASFMPSLIDRRRTRRWRRHHIGGARRLHLGLRCDNASGEAQHACHGPRIADRDDEVCMVYGLEGRAHRRSFFIHCRAA